MGISPVEKEHTSAPSNSRPTASFAYQSGGAVPHCHGTF